MDTDIAERDTSLKAQADLIDARARAMAHMSTEIAHRDIAITAQGQLLEERFAAMEEMGREIHGLTQRLDVVFFEKNQIYNELDALRRTWWIRIGLALCRRLGRPH